MSILHRRRVACQAHQADQAEPETNQDQEPQDQEPQDQEPQDQEPQDQEPQDQGKPAATPAPGMIDRFFGA